MKQQMFAFVLGEVANTVGGESFTWQMAKSAPAYSELSLPRQVVVGQELVQVAGRDVNFQLRGYPPDVLVVRASIEVEDIFRKETFALESDLYRHCYRILEQYGGSRQSSEEYSIFLVAGYEGTPQQFFDHAPFIASLLKSERQELDPKEVQYTLQAQIQYAKNDLAIIDWDGAFLFDPEGDIESEVELLTLANLQLLRHRILDRQLDVRLARMAELVRQPAHGKLVFRNKEISQDLVEIIRHRMSSISELQRLERDIKLIGDWYSARLYALATAKFKLEEWRTSILSKLDFLEDMYSIVVENFSVSRKQQAEWAQIILFFVLQVGWFLLIILEFLYFTRRS